MNCNEVQNRLSEYVEKTLDAETLKSVDDHLGFCSRCRAEAENLARTVQLVAALPKTQPPVGFTTRVMARVREVEAHASFWQRLLLPFRNTIPLQATAVVLIGILAVYMYQKEQPEKKEPLAHQNDSLPQQAEERAVPPAPPLPASPESKAGVGREAPVHDTKPQTARRQQKPSEMLRDSNEQARPAPPPPSSSPAIAGEERGGGERPKAADQLGAGVGQLQSSELAKERALRSAAPTAARSQIAAPNYDLVLRLREQQALSGQVGALREQQEADRTRAPQKSGGLIARYLPGIPRSDRPETLWLNIPQTDYDQFKKELATLGIIESERQIATRDKETTSKPDEPLRIRLTVLPARDAGQQAPAVQP
ncbi:MAG TPA: DUF2275 domain-containing protein [Candidatus Binatia bacterium]|nr:DUF2275 domain-containing protein [Candidatus Binatia bacterium]